LAVTDLEGKPRPAEVCLRAVDESVYTFGEDRSGDLARLFSDPHPSRRYFRKTWRCSTGNRPDFVRYQDQLAKQAASIDSLKQAQPVLEESSPLANVRERPLALASLGGELPVTSVPLARLRSDFRETAAWQPQLRTGPDGVVRTTFALPDSLTRYRLSALALTPDTAIGTARSEVTVSLPLAVQVLLPRFAVEKDRLLAVALLHNGTGRERTCSVAWEVQGARVEGPGPELTDWRLDATAEKSSGQGKVTVPGGGSRRVGLWLVLDHPGPVTITARCSDAEDADAETRTLTVQPLGREREVALERTFSGKERLQLPDGFTARELRIVLARSPEARALEGLARLIEYPYGCVEQTMSRFLPAVLARDATRQGPLELPPEVAGKLPEVLERGLTRLYAFQHEDGGWGWWEHDATDPRMTVYVVYGLARCRLAGVTVDKQVLDRGCAHLQEMLAAGKLDDVLAARAWRALTLAGAANADELRKQSATALERHGNPEARCHLALACRAAHLESQGEALAAVASAWQAENTEQVSLKLSTQIAFGESLSRCQQSSRRLLERQTGLQWENTQATAAAIDALCQMLRHVTAGTSARKVQVSVGGRVVLDLPPPEELAKLVYRVSLPAGRVPAEAALPIDVVCDCAGPVSCTVTAAGTQRLDKIEPIGSEIKMERRLETLDGQPVTGPVRAGEVIAVRLRIDLTRPQEYVLIEDRLPAGCEFADERLAPAGKPEAGKLAHVEFRDDRVCAFAGSLAAGRHEFVYYLRAETPGTSHILPGVVYPMYSDRTRGETGAAHLEITDREGR
jgi:uncharacterized protein YfaS (alpha-2-macroglobulin family)